MALINANYSFNTTPATPGGAVAVTGDTQSEIKDKVKAVLLARRAVQQGGTDALDQDLAALDA
jgi:hypothetical protein